MTSRGSACYHPLQTRSKMAHRFKVGQLVEYKPVGAKVSQFKIVRHLPEEFPAADWKYRIKSDQEGFERTVLECDLVHRSCRRCRTTRSSLSASRRALIINVAKLPRMRGHRTVGGNSS